MSHLILLPLLSIATIAGAQAPAAQQATLDVAALAAGANAGGGPVRFRLPDPAQSLIEPKHFRERLGSTVNGWRFSCKLRT